MYNLLFNKKVYAAMTKWQRVGYVLIAILTVTDLAYDTWFHH